MSEPTDRQDLLRRAGWYRDRATELRAIADGTSDERSRTALEGAARSYDDMAELCERRAASGA